MFLFYNFTVVRESDIGYKETNIFNFPQSARVSCCSSSCVTVSIDQNLFSKETRKLKFYLLLFAVSLLCFTPWSHLASFPLPPFCMHFFDILVWSLLRCPCVWHVCVTETSGLSVQPNPGADTVPSWVMGWAQPQLSEVKRRRMKLALTWVGRGGTSCKTAACVWVLGGLAVWGVLHTHSHTAHWWKVFHLLQPLLLWGEERFPKLGIKYN